MKVLLTGATALALLASTSAYAAVATLQPPDYAGTFSWNNNGTVGGGSGFTDVIQQDKDWGQFGGVLPSALFVTPQVSFSFSNVNNVDIHSITFTDPLFAAKGGGTWTWSYAITITDPSVNRFLSASADIVQSDGTSSLDKLFLDNVGDTYNIDFAKTGNNIVSGNSRVFFDKVDDMLFVTETLTVPVGSTVTAVGNSFVQQLAPTIPEPSTWAMMLLGFAGLGFAGYRKADRMSSAAA